MPRVRCAALAFFGLLGCSFALSTVPACADDDLYAPHHGDYMVEGTVQSVSRSDDRLTLAGTDNHRYIVDAYGADILLRESHRLGETTDLARGMRVEVTGTLLGRNLLEASRLRVLPTFRGTLAEDLPVAPPQAVALPPEPAPTTPLPAEPAPPPAQPQLNLDGLVREVDAARDQVTLLGDDDKRYTLDTHAADIILRGTERAGQTADLARGMRVRLIGALLPDGRVEADRLRVLAAPEAPAAPPAPVTPVVEDMSVYTGVLIDARSLPRISRSPAPAIYGALPDQSLLYPDRSHVPTPDEVQEESVVRYYHAESEAESGIGAGGAGIPAFFTKTGVGTLIAEGKEERNFNGSRYIMETGLVADLAIIHAWRGDTEGNLVYRMTARNFNPPMATAAHVTVAEVEELGGRRPDRSGSHHHPRHLRPAHDQARTLRKRDRATHHAPPSLPHRRPEPCPGPETRWPPAPPANCRTAFTSISASASPRWSPTTFPPACT